MHGDKEVQRKAQDWLIVGAITALILACLPLLAAVGLILQLGFAVVAPVAVTAMLVGLLVHRQPRSGEV